MTTGTTLRRIPLAELHQIGQPAFELRWGLDLTQLAKRSGK